MPETVNPAIADLLLNDELVNGDIGAAQDELVRRLQMLLPGVIAARNAAKGWTGGAAIPTRGAGDIESAPADLTDRHIGKILVDVNVETSAQGIGGVFRNTASVTIYSVEARIKVSQQLRVHWQFAESIRLCLFPFIGGCTDANNQRVWKSLVPTGYALASDDRFKNYSATQTTFTLIQSPSQNSEPV